MYTISNLGTMEISGLLKSFIGNFILNIDF